MAKKTAPQTEPEFESIGTDLPPVERGNHKYKQFYEACEANPGQWLIMRKDAKSGRAASRKEGFKFASRRNPDGETFTVYCAFGVEEKEKPAKEKKGKK